MSGKTDVAPAFEVPATADSFDALVRAAEDDFEPMAFLEVAALT